MGLCGLALAWHRAVPLMGTAADHVALALGVLAAAVFAVLALASVWRARRHPQAFAEDLKHPVRHPFMAAITVSLILLATVAVALGGPSPWARALWWVGSLGQLAATVWVLARWWRGNQAGGLHWAGVTPLLLIPVVGNVLAPLAGVPLGHAEWSAAQLGIGLLFWPVLLVMVLVRVAVAGLWPDRLRPAVFIFTAPPAVLGLAVLQLGAPLALGWAFWGMALFSLLWAATQLPAIRRQAFAVAHWALSFPLAAFTALTLRLAEPGSALVVPAMALLAASSLLVAALLLATVRGLRAGTLLAPETVAVIQPASA
jgi:tellurite resistance protein